MWVLVKHFEHVGFVILAVEHDQHAPRREIQNLALEGVEDVARILVRIQFDSLDAVLADHSSPEGVVAIENQHFSGPSLQSGSELGDLPCVSGEKSLLE